MASRNYYVVLGVASTESEEGIRSAYRELARELHPDHAGPTGAGRFRELTEAYEVLRDPRLRREYDASLEPTGLERRVSLRRDLAEVRPSEEAMFGRFARNFGGGGRRGEHVQDLGVDVAISAEEAARGTSVRVGVPVFGRCGGCLGRGCSACGWQGIAEGERAITIDVPPMSGRGTTFVVPLGGLGIHNFFLSVRVRVDTAIAPPSRA